MSSSSRIFRIAYSTSLHQPAALRLSPLRITHRAPHFCTTTPSLISDDKPITPDAIEKEMREFNAKVQQQKGATRSVPGNPPSPSSPYIDKSKKKAGAEENESAAERRDLLADKDPEQIAVHGNQTLKGASFKPKN